MASNLLVDSIVPATGSSVSIGTATGGVNIPGVLTYEDVTNVDSVGVITARSGINVSGGGVDITTGGLVVTGISTTTARLDVGNNGTNAVDLRFRSNRASAGQTIANLNYEWNGTTVAQIRGIAGSDTTNKDDGHLAFYTTPAGSGSFSERLRIGSAGQLGIGGANYGTSGQVLTSQGSGSAIQWATPGNLIVTRSVNADISGGNSYDFTLPANCYKVDFVGHNIRMSASGTPSFQIGTTAGMITSGGKYNYTETAYGGSNAGRYQSGDNEIRFGYYNLNASSDTGEVFASFESSSASNFWIVQIDSHRRTQTGYLKTMCALDLDGNNLTTIRLYGWSGVNFATGRYSFTAYSTS